jgi:hypothetical protein
MKGGGWWMWTSVEGGGWWMWTSVEGGEVECECVSVL